MLLWLSVPESEELEPSSEVEDDAAGLNLEFESGAEDVDEGHSGSVIVAVVVVRVFGVARRRDNENDGFFLKVFFIFFFGDDFPEEEAVEMHILVFDLFYRTFLARRTLFFIFSLGPHFDEGAVEEAINYAAGGNGRW